MRGFGGLGWVAEKWDELGESPTVGAGGAGFRYLIARQLGRRSGLAFAFGRDGEFAFNIQVGSAWR